MRTFYKQTWQSLYKIFLIIGGFKVWNDGSQGGSLVSFSDSYLSHGTKTDGWINTKIMHKNDSLLIESNGASFYSVKQVQFYVLK